MTPQTIERQCNDCQLCCKLLPVRSPLLNKESNTKCPHQKFSVGCLVYNSPRMPSECGLWNCRWLVNDDTAKLSRPDRSHVVIDLMPDFIVAQNNETGFKQNLEVIQIWVDARYPEAWRDPELLSYLERRGVEGKAALIRYNAHEKKLALPAKAYTAHITPPRSWTHSAISRSGQSPTRTRQSP